MISNDEKIESIMITAGRYDELANAQKKLISIISKKDKKISIDCLLANLKDITISGSHVSCERIPYSYFGVRLYFYVERKPGIRMQNNFMDMLVYAM